MRKVKITKQNVVNPKAVYMGLSIKQLVIMGGGIALALITIILFFFCWNINIDLTMTLVFLELAISASLSVIQINGMSLIKWIRITMQSPIVRPYQSKGVLDKYVDEEKKDKK